MKWQMEFTQIVPSLVLQICPMGPRGPVRPLVTLEAGGILGIGASGTAQDPGGPRLGDPRIFAHVPQGSRSKGPVTPGDHGRPWGTLGADWDPLADCRLAPKCSISSCATPWESREPSGLRRLGAGSTSNPSSFPLRGGAYTFLEIIQLLPSAPIFQSKLSLAP